MYQGDHWGLECFTRAFVWSWRWCGKVAARGRCWSPTWRRVSAPWWLLLCPPWPGLAQTLVRCDSKTDNRHIHVYTFFTLKQNQSFSRGFELLTFDTYIWYILIYIYVCRVYIYVWCGLAQTLVKSFWEIFLVYDKMLVYL